MKKKRKKRHAPLKDGEQKLKRKIPGKKLLILSASLIVIFSVYQIAIYFYAEWILHAYCIAAGILAVVYIAFNRGMLTVPDREMLPGDWSEEKKDSFIAEQAVRRKKSSVLLYILIPIILTVVFDMIYIYLTYNMGLDI